MVPLLSPGYAVIELITDQFASCPPLTPVPIFSGFARAVLEGYVAGQVWVDRLESPRAAYGLHGYGIHTSRRACEAVVRLIPYRCDLGGGYGLEFGSVRG